MVGCSRSQGGHVDMPRWRGHGGHVPHRAVLGCAAPPWSGGVIEEKTEPPLFLFGRRLLFVVPTAGTSSATAFRFRGGRL